MDQLLEKFSPEKVDEILDLPPGSTARYVRINALEARLDERAVDIALVVKHNEGEGASALAAIDTEGGRRRSAAEAAAETAGAGRGRAVQVDTIKTRVESAYGLSG